MTRPDLSQGMTNLEHDEWVKANGRPVTQSPRKRRKPKEVTDMPATGYSIVDTYLEGDK